MARWMRDYTAAETNTPKADNLKVSERSWQRRRSSDRWLWLSCLAISLASAIIWFYATEQSLFGQDQSAKLESSNSNVSSKQAGETLNNLGSGDSQVNPTTLITENEQTSEEVALRWWIDAAPRPSGQDLQLCLSNSQNVEVDIHLGEGGLSVLTQGRKRPQIIYEQNEQLWIKTPLLSTAHQQAYDHLLLVSCLRSPGATLFDPLLVRQWGGEDWPQRNQNTGALALDDLFLIRSQGDAHFTYGLFRLGLPELGLQNKSGEARNLLRQLALFWIIHPKAREELQALSIKFKMGKHNLQLSQGDSLVAWLGPKKVQVLVDQGAQVLSEQSLQKLLLKETKPKKTLKPNRQTKRKVHRSSRSKRRKASRKGKKSRSKSKTKAPLNLQYR